MNTIESTPASTATPGSLRQVATDLQDTARDAIPGVRRQVDTAADATRDAAASLIDNLRSAAKDAAGVLRRDAHHSKDVAARYIGSNPWRAAAMIGAAGLLLGAALTRRR